MWGLPGKMIHSACVGARALDPLRLSTFCCSHEERAEIHEAVPPATAQNSVHSSSSQPFIDPAVRDALINPKYRIQGMSLFADVSVAGAHRTPYLLLLCAVLRFEADVERFVRQGDQQDLTFDATLTGYQV